MMPTTILMFVLGLGLLVAGAEVLVRGASRLALVAGISPLVIGLTIVAFGTSAPEMAVGAQSALTGRADIVLGNVVGSNIFNILFILGLSALLAPLLVKQRLIRLDVPLVMMLSLVLYALAWDGTLSRSEGVLLFGGILLYTLFCIWSSRRESKEITAEYDEAFGASVPGRGRRDILSQAALVGLGFIMLLLGSRWLLESAVSMARGFGVSELVIGLTIVSIGTSLPEVATSVMASLRGERDIAVGNVVGSNLFNLLAVLGVASLLSPQPVVVSDLVLRVDLPVMIAVSVACLPLFLTGRITRWMGALFLGYYLVYAVYLFLGATNSPFLTPFLSVVGYVLLPLTVLILLLVLFRLIVGRRAALTSVAATSVL